MNFVSRNSSVKSATPSTSPSQQSVMYTRDWRTALRTPPPYRIGNRSVRFNYHIGLIVVAVCGLFILFFYTRTGSSSSSNATWVKTYASSTNAHSSTSLETSHKFKGDATTYNNTYPLTAPLTIRGNLISYRIAMVADLDTKSKVKLEDGSFLWRSFLKKGYLTYTASGNTISIKWDSGEPIPLDSGFSLKGRGMELSELVTFNGKLLTFDDRTGLIYELVNDKPVPWVILLDGDGHSTKGFKSEWATVKSQSLYVGSMGKEWTTSNGDFQNEDPMYVKVITPSGEVRSLDWSFNFKLMRQQSQQISWPGYMIHESGIWSELHQQWYFLPRRCSNEKYNETRDEHMGCNVLISADERFTHIETVPLDAPNTAPTHGFSSFKFIPGTEDRIILAIRTEELNGKTSTFVTSFDITGKILLPEQRVDTDLKYEGIEFI